MKNKPINVLTMAVAIAAFGLMIDAARVRADSSMPADFINSSSTDLNTTVYDDNSGQSSPILSNQRINAGSDVRSDIVGDKDRQGKVRWTSRFTDGKCVSGSKSGFSSGDNVNVAEGSSC